MSAADWVLRPFAKAELNELGVLLEETVDAVEALVRDGLTAAQNAVHGKRADTR